jgi:NADPH:quinone reductase-like Zn-dependent oxidoreductase
MEDTNVQIQIKEYNIDDPTAGVEAVASAIPEPQQGQVLVRMKLRPINPADVFSVQGERSLNMGAVHTKSKKIAATSEQTRQHTRAI